MDDSLTAILILKRLRSLREVLILSRRFPLMLCLELFQPLENLFSLLCPLLFVRQSFLYPILLLLCRCLSLSSCDVIRSVMLTDLYLSSGYPGCLALVWYPSYVEGRGRGGPDSARGSRTGRLFDERATHPWVVHQ